MRSAHWNHPKSLPFQCLHTSSLHHTDFMQMQLHTYLTLTMCVVSYRFRTKEALWWKWVKLWSGKTLELLLDHTLYLRTSKSPRSVCRFVMLSRGYVKQKTKSTPSEINSFANRSMWTESLFEGHVLNFGSVHEGNVGFQNYSTWITYISFFLV